jgi:ribulose bisphosphate carboxylase small subunit
MAQRTVRVDDLDGASEDARPVTFALEGVTYDIDLSEKHISQLRDALSQFMEAGRARQKPKTDSRPRLNKEQLAAIRKWGHDNGYEFSDQGRIPNHVMEAWEKFGGKGKLFSSA